MLQTDNNKERMKNRIKHIPEWIWTALGGIIGLCLFALLMILGDYLNSIQ